MLALSLTHFIGYTVRTNDQVMIDCVTFYVAVVYGVLPTPDTVLPDTKPNDVCHILSKFYTSAVFLGKNTNILLYTLFRNGDLCVAVTFCVFP